MEKEEYSAKLTLEQESCINGRNVYHYLIDTSIGEIHRQVGYNRLYYSCSRK